MPWTIPPAVVRTGRRAIRHPVRTPALETIKLGIGVHAEGHPIPIFDLSFRILADPGTVTLKDGALWFSCGYAGKATITLDALRTSSAAAYGQASVVVPIKP